MLDPDQDWKRSDRKSEKLLTGSRLLTTNSAGHSDGLHSIDLRLLGPFYERDTKAVRV